MLITLPPPDDAITGRAYLQTKNTLVRFVAKARCHSARSSSTTLPATSPSAAPLTTMSSRPNFSTAPSTQRWTVSASDTSPGHAIARPLPAPISPAIREAPASSISRHATAAPSAANNRAVSPAIAPAAPVTNATLPSNLFNDPSYFA